LIINENLSIIPFYCLDSIADHTADTEVHVVEANKKLVQAVQYQVSYLLFIKN